MSCRQSIGRFRKKSNVILNKVPVFLDNFIKQPVFSYKHVLIDMHYINIRSAIPITTENNFLTSLSGSIDGHS